MSRSRLGGVAALIGLTVAVGQAAELVNLTTLMRDGQVLVSFELAGAFTDDVRSTIESGLQMTFQYDVQLKREAAFWPDSTIASATLATTVRFDNLTEQYNVVRTLDGRVEDTMVVDEAKCERCSRGSTGLPCSARPRSSQTARTRFV